MESAILFGAAVLLFIWGMYNYLGYRKEKKEIQKKYLDLFKRERQRSSLIAKVGDRFDQTEYALDFKKKLIHANIPVLPSEFYAILIFIGFFIAILLFGFFNIPLTISAGIAAIFMIASYWLIFFVRKNKYTEQLNNQLSEVCRLLGNATKSGMTIIQGLEVVAAEINSPAKEEFKVLTQNIRLGLDFDRALVEMEKRIQTREYKLFISALMVQKSSGGNLTKVLYEMAQTLEERKILRQTIKTATAEQRFVSYILPAMPIFLLFMLNNIMDGFIDLIFTVPGAILMTIFTIGMVVALIMVRAVTNIKV
ncbi:MULTISPECIES: type II secretion system F family protein [Bacillaceae]|uniref:type II secretion system F family protein n=1 Tax=Bacillaceae TaxID=186817 RepID=UPI0029643D65|nr:type II secretion system F family protein [Bacillus infantis]MDW2879567.1 type II secretion system F family protein [Bacillus infantis]